MTVRIEHVLKETIKDLKVRITELEKERDEARKEAEKWRELAEGLLDYIRHGYKSFGDLSRLPWES